MSQLIHQRQVALAPQGLVPNGYLTDGINLMRVVSRFDADADSVFVSLEDCRTLEIRPYASGELRAMDLRPVQPAGESPGAVQPACESPSAAEPAANVRTPRAPSPRRCGPEGETRRGRSVRRRISMQVTRCGEGWELMLPDTGQAIWCESLDDARRVAFLCGAHAQPCELIVHHGHEHVRTELIGDRASGA